MRFDDFVMQCIMALTCMMGHYPDQPETQWVQRAKAELCQKELTNPIIRKATCIVRPGELRVEKPGEKAHNQWSTLQGMRQGQKLKEFSLHWLCAACL